MFNTNTKLSYFFVGLFLFLIFELSAEGTKQLAPSSTDRAYLYTNSTAYNDFGRYDGSDDQRLYVHIDNPATEQLFLGFSQPVGSGHHPCNGSTEIIGFFRIKDPTGRIVYPIRDNAHRAKLARPLDACPGQHSHLQSRPLPCRPYRHWRHCRLRCTAGAGDTWQ